MSRILIRSGLSGAGHRVGDGPSLIARPSSPEDGMRPADIESRRYAILSESEIETLHEKTLRLLQRVGIVIEHAGPLSS